MAQLLNETFTYGYDVAQLGIETKPKTSVSSTETSQKTTTNYIASTATPSQVLGALTVLSLFLGMIICVLNSLVITVFIRIRKIRTPANLFTTCLATADFFMGIVMLVYAFSNFWPEYTKSRCLGELCIMYVFGTASMVTIAVIAADRFIAIVYPLYYERIITKKRAGLGVLAVWTYSGLIGTMPVYWNVWDLTIERSGKAPDCHLSTVITAGYKITLTVVVLGLTLAWCTGVYCKIFTKIRDQRRKMRLFRHLSKKALTAARKQTEKTRKSVPIFQQLPIIKTVPAQMAHTTETIQNGTSYVIQGVPPEKPEQENLLQGQIEPTPPAPSLISGISSSIFRRFGSRKGNRLASGHRGVAGPILGRAPKRFVSIQPRGRPDWNSSPADPFPSARITTPQASVVPPTKNKVTDPRRIRSNVRPTRGSGQPTSEQIDDSLRSGYRKKFRSTKAQMMIFCVFAVMWLPLMIAVHLELAGLINDPTHLAVSVSKYFGVLNSIVNPIIYAVRLRDYRYWIKRFLSCRLSRRDTRRYDVFGWRSERPNIVLEALRENSHTRLSRIRINPMRERSYSVNF